MNYCERIKNSPEVLNQVRAVEGSLFFIRTEDFESIGLFDEKIFLFLEEDILAVKMSRLRKKIGVLNNVTWIHNHRESKSQSASIETKKSERYYFMNYIAKKKAQKLLYIFLTNFFSFEISIILTLRWLISFLKK